MTRNHTRPHINYLQARGARAKKNFDDLVAAGKLKEAIEALNSFDQEVQEDKELFDEKCQTYKNVIGKSGDSEFISEEDKVRDQATLKEVLSHMEQGRHSIANVMYREWVDQSNSKRKSPDDKRKSVHENSSEEEEGHDQDKSAPEDSDDGGNR